MPNGRKADSARGVSQGTHYQAPVAALAAASQADTEGAASEPLTLRCPLRLTRAEAGAEPASDSEVSGASTSTSPLPPASGRYLGGPGDLEAAIILDSGARQ